MNITLNFQLFTRKHEKIPTIPNRNSREFVWNNRDRMKCYFYVTDCKTPCLQKGNLILPIT